MRLTGWGSCCERFDLIGGCQQGLKIIQLVDVDAIAEQPPVNEAGAAQSAVLGEVMLRLLRVKAFVEFLEDRFLYGFSGGRDT